MGSGTAADMSWTAESFASIMRMAPTKATQAGSSPAEVVARSLLAELVTEQRLAPDSPDVTAAIDAARKLVNPGQGLVDADISTRPRKQGHSPGAIFEALRILRQR